MKKKAAVLLSLMLMTVGVLAGCGNSNNDMNSMEEVTEENGIISENVPGESMTGAGDNNLNNNGNENNNSGNNNTGNENNGSIRTGVAIESSDDLDDQDETEEKEKEEMTVAAVVLHADGRVAKCIIDETQYSVSSTADDQAEGYQTKQELGEKYGMKQASSIHKEWNEQADAFAKYCEGKTVEEIRGIAVNDDGYVREADLAATCTIEVEDFKDVVVKAINNAKDSQAGVSDKIGVGVVDDAVAAVTLDTKGKITSITLDGYYMAENTNTMNWLDKAASYVENIVGNTIDDLGGMSQEDKEGFPEEFGVALTKAINNAR